MPNYEEVFPVLVAASYFVILSKLNTTILGITSSWLLGTRQLAFKLHVIVFLFRMHSSLGMGASIAP
jgi:hypothetical protein